ncbi:(4Fe-4S)-binding protein [Aurantibacillus circumpalustris]|uniref:(4Fe-4S)-binding protein n=1 Tax=Aurantibacillus circumpalustris TaxID=3036359 RepID=UPI00295B0592|nr:(4Fe-4S)-binding protein [Aurantibacillus circumpalustris]
MERDITKKYTNGEITIVWKPSTCIHSTLCWKGSTGLPEVFNPQLKPWIMPEGANTDKVIEHVKKCPSGALSFYYNNEVEGSTQVSAETKIEAAVNGPLLVYGNVLIKDSKGTEIRKNNVTALCRCGKSDNKPFCDGSHVKHNFEG